MIRLEQEADQEAIHQVVTTAFGQVGEAELVDNLRRNGKLVLSLVAEEAGQVVGHVAFSPVRVFSPTGDWEALGMGPVAVSPAFQRRGIGSTLVQEGLAHCREEGHGVIFVLGNPAFYGRFGFTASAPFGIRWEQEVPPEYFQVVELYPGALMGRSGIVRYGSEFASV